MSEADQPEWSSLRKKERRWWSLVRSLSGGLCPGKKPLGLQRMPASSRRLYTGYWWGNIQNTKGTRCTLVKESHRQLFPLSGPIESGTGGLPVTPLSTALFVYVSANAPSLLRPMVIIRSYLKPAASVCQIIPEHQKNKHSVEELCQWQLQKKVQDLKEEDDAKQCHSWLGFCLEMS